MPEFVCRENGYLWRVPELCSDQWNSAEEHSRKCIIDGEWPSSIQYFPHTELHTKGYCYKQEVGYYPHCAELWQGESPGAQCYL